VQLVITAISIFPDNIFMKLMMSEVLSNFKYLILRLLINSRYLNVLAIDHQSKFKLYFFDNRKGKHPMLLRYCVIKNMKQIACFLYLP
jgi:hypothetical protein